MDLSTVGGGTRYRRWTGAEGGGEGIFKNEAF